jgi:hypothetical protein
VQTRLHKVYRGDKKQSDEFCTDLISNFAVKWRRVWYGHRFGEGKLEKYGCLLQQMQRQWKLDFVAACAHSLLSEHHVRRTLCDLWSSLGS